jgi:serine/threonine protein kinase
MLLKDGTIKVADFGIAELQSNLSGYSDQAVGSVHYMAPEQAKGARGRRQERHIFSGHRHVRDAHRAAALYRRDARGDSDKAHKRQSRAAAS